MADEEKKEGEEKVLEVDDGYFQAPELIFNIPKPNEGDKGEK
jgi:hypothetical protein